MLMDKVVFCSRSSAPLRAVTQRHFLSDARGFITDLQNFLHSEGNENLSSQSKLENCKLYLSLSASNQLELMLML